MTSVNLLNQLNLWLQKRQLQTCHRQLLVISGKQEWAIKAAITVCNENTNQKNLWVGEPQVNFEHIKVENYRSELGQEYENVVLDCFEGFRASAAMALSGTIKANGLMLIICPEFDKWPNYNDPQHINRISYGYTQTNIQSLFFRYLSERFNEEGAVSILTTTHFSGSVHFIKDVSIGSKFDQQNQAIQAIQTVAMGHRNRPLVLTADRGRGKSSALGIAAANLMQNNTKNIWLTAPTKHAVKQVLLHNQRLLPNSVIRANLITYETSSLTYKAIDDLLLSDETADLLLVDEAAAIPVHILIKLVEKFPRIVFSSTVHGYEGSGRGFELKFKKILRTIKPEFKSLHMSQPIRWFQKDVLEQFWFETMFYASTSTTNASMIDSDKVECRQITQIELLAKQDLLADVFELLTNAHYQTSPDDLQRLLDSPEVRLYLLTLAGKVIGVTQVLEEGGEGLSSISNEVAACTKRVKGHMVAQLLSSTYNNQDFCEQAQWRISRIAVFPDYQNKGYGKRLLTYVEEQAIAQDIAFMTTAFGCTQPLLNFWKDADYHPVRLSLKPDASSGERSCICIKPLNSDSALNCTIFAQEFNQDLLFYMDKEFSELPANQLLMLLENIESEHSHLNDLIIQQFINGSRNLNSSRRIINQKILANVKKVKELSTQEQAFLVYLLLQNSTNKAVSKEFNLVGKKAIEQKVKCILTKILT